jgi:hypothetical protein
MVFMCVVVPSVLATNAQSDDFGTSGYSLMPGSSHLQGPLVGGTSANDLLGAQRFYNAGFTGTNAVMANIEAGHVWNGHETLAHVTYIPTSGASGEVDRHATWVAMVMGGRPNGAKSGDYQRGMAPDAQLASGAIALSWSSSATRYSGNFNPDFNGISTIGQYRAAFITGVPASGGPRTADVINSSYNGNGDLAGSDTLSGTLDALLNENPRTLLTSAAGNTLPTGDGPNRVPLPASSYNGISVASLAPNGGSFDVWSIFSNGGPNDYFDPVSGTIGMVRQVVDLAAPGEQVNTAYYGGETGGNGPSLMGAANGPAGGPDFYTRSVRGTSFASAAVAGGAALLYDAAYEALASTPDARDSRVMKSVLMNSADKTVDWDNGQAEHPNAGGGVFTTRGVDNRVGAGRMNLDRAFDQLLTGTTDLSGTAHGMLGSVNPVGWDFGEVAEGTPNDYLINGVLEAGSLFSATLNWYRDRSTVGTTGYADNSFDDLDLELWSAAGGSPLGLISQSSSRYNNTEHFHFAIPTTGEYMLRVRWVSEVFDVVADANLEKYGLAWAALAVPEPATLLLLAILLPVMVCTRERHV